MKVRIQLLETVKKSLAQATQIKEPVQVAAWCPVEETCLVHRKVCHELDCQHVVLHGKHVCESALKRHRPDLTTYNQLWVIGEVNMHEFRRHLQVGSHNHVLFGTSEECSY